MQNAKDTFYEVLRSRLAALNASRTIVVRGVTRPGVFVEENELLSEQVIPDCFRLRWADMDIDLQGTLPLVKMRCEVLYETAGTPWGAGMDRGRMLEAMDAELCSAATSVPTRATKTSYAAEVSGGSPTSLGSAIWWSAPEFGAAEVHGERLRRAAIIEVMSYQEAGEL